MIEIESIYGLTKAGYFDAMMGSDPVPADNTLQQGNVIYNKKVIGDNNELERI